MFASRSRPIIYPQMEHGRLAGALARLWGNADFHAPPIPCASLVLGVGLHDRGYGALDDDPLLELPEPRWLEITRRGFNDNCGDAAADLITRLHLRRLVSYDLTPARRALLAEMDTAISGHAAAHGLDLALYRRLDALTRLCDSVAFDFCFEEPAEGEVAVSLRWGVTAPTRAVRYRVTPAGKGPAHIALSPWPLGVGRHEGYAVAYRAAGYPGRLVPVVVPYVVTPG